VKWPELGWQVGFSDALDTRAIDLRLAVGFNHKVSQFCLPLAGTRCGNALNEKF
jgi:hypothetical protein